MRMAERVEVVSNHIVEVPSGSLVAHAYMRDANEFLIWRYQPPLFYSPSIFIIFPYHAGT
jgi:hypothetical protein